MTATLLVEAALLRMGVAARGQQHLLFMWCNTVRRTCPFPDLPFAWMQAGFKDIGHLEGGLNQWRYDGYPVMRNNRVYRQEPPKHKSRK